MSPETAKKLDDDAKRFTVVEGIDKDNPFVESELTPIEQKVEMSSDAQAAQHFLQLKANEYIVFMNDPDKKKGYLRETAWQNEMARAFYNRQIPDIDRAISTLKKNILGIMKGRGFSVEARNKSMVQLDDYRVGIQSMLEAVNKSQADFARTASANERQVIAMNDRHDAEEAIDYYDIRYDNDQVTEIILVQSKSSVAKRLEGMGAMEWAREKEQGLEEKASSSKASHKEFVDKIPDMKQLAKESVKPMIDHIRAFKNFRHELEDRENLSERHEYMVKKLGDPVYEYIVGVSEDIEESEHEELINQIAKENHIVVANLAVLFGGSDAKDLFYEIANDCGAMKEESQLVDEAYPLMRAWALKNQPDFADLLPLDDKWPQLEEWMKTVRISSQFYSSHGDGPNNLIFQAKTAADIKILTKRAA